MNALLNSRSIKRASYIEMVSSVASHKNALEFISGCFVKKLVNIGIGLLSWKEICPYQVNHCATGQEENPASSR